MSIQRDLGGSAAFPGTPPVVRPDRVSTSGECVITDPGGVHETVAYQGPDVDAAALVYAAATQAATAGTPVEWWSSGLLHQRFRI